jgi:PAS domain S-box-containing protein
MAYSLRGISLRGIAWTAFALAVALLIGSSVFLYRATQKLTASEVLVAHTHEVETVLEDLGSAVFQASNSCRAFVLTGDDSLLHGYRSAVAEIPGDLNHLRRLTADNPSHGEELKSVEADINTELGLMSKSIRAHRRGLSDLDSDADVATQTEDLGDRVQQALQKMRVEEDQLLQQRQAVSRTNYHRTLKLIGVSFLVALALLGAQMFTLNYAFTQYQRKESAARQSQEIVDAFFSGSTVRFGILDSQFRYTRVNEVFPRLLGVKAGDLLGKSVFDIFGERGAHTESVLREMLHTGHPVQDLAISADLPGKPGQIRHWLVNYFPIPDDSGVFTQVGLIAVDVTARRNAEAALRKLSGRLLGIQDQERRRIARELHDSLGQYLAGLKIALEVLSRSPQSEKDATLLAECGEILEKSITETRTLSHLLHPPLLDEAGFASAAGWFVTGFSQRSGIPVSLDLPPDLPRLPQAVEIALFRVLQESLTNVHRHSHAASAEITVDADAEQITMEILDHGKGMPQEVLEHIEDGSKLGVGLAGMRERIRELGGEFEVTSDENGTMVRATVPLSGREEEDQVSAAIERRELDRGGLDGRGPDRRKFDKREEEQEERIANAFWRPRGGAS